MDGFVGPFSEARTLLQLGVLFGGLLIGLVWIGTNLLGVPLSPEVTPYTVVGALLLGLSLVFVGHVVWHYRRTHQADDN